MSTEKTKLFLVRLLYYCHTPGLVTFLLNSFYFISLKYILKPTKICSTHLGFVNGRILVETLFYMWIRSLYINIELSNKTAYSQIM